MATQTAVQIAGAATNSDLAAAALGLGAQVGISLPFSREQESEADILGIRYMHAAGYDPKQAIPFWQRMEQGGGSRPPEERPPVYARGWFWGVVGGAAAAALIVGLAVGLSGPRDPPLDGALFRVEALGAR